MTVPPFFSTNTQSSESASRRWMLATMVTLVTAGCAQLSVPLPFTPVPATLQVFAVLFSGLLLGARWGAIAQIQYLALGLLGAPIFAEHRAGIGVLLLPTAGGYLLSFPIAAFVTGWIAERVRDAEKPLLPVWACAAGLAIIYGMGCTWLALLTRPMLSPTTAFMFGAGWFLAWDAVKAMGAVLLVHALKRR